MGMMDTADQVAKEKLKNCFIVTYKEEATPTKYLALVIALSFYQQLELIGHTSGKSNFYGRHGTGI